MIPNVVMPEVDDVESLPRGGRRLTPKFVREHDQTVRPAAGPDPRRVRRIGDRAGDQQHAAHDGAQRSQRDLVAAAFFFERHVAVGPQADQRRRFVRERVGERARERCGQAISTRHVGWSVS